MSYGYFNLHYYETEYRSYTFSSGINESVELYQCVLKRRNPGFHVRTYHNCVKKKKKKV